VQRVTFPELSMLGLATNIVDPDGAAARNIAAVATELTKKGGQGNVVQAA
jgi:chromosome partitioning protein